MHEGRPWTAAVVFLKHFRSSFSCDVVSEKTTAFGQSLE